VYKLHSCPAGQERYKQNCIMIATIGVLLLRYCTNCLPLCKTEDPRPSWTWHQICVSAEL